MKHLSLSEKLFALRANAASLYAVSIANDLPGQEIQEVLAPIQKKLTDVITAASHLEVGDCVVAIKRLENLNKCYQEDIKFLMQKVIDNNHHSDRIKNALLDRMSKEGVIELHKDGYTAVMITVDGKDDIKVS